MAMQDKSNSNSRNESFVKRLTKQHGQGAGNYGRELLKNKPYNDYYSFAQDALSGYHSQDQKRTFGKAAAIM